MKSNITQNILIKHAIRNNKPIIIDFEMGKIDTNKINKFLKSKQLNK